MRPLLEEFKRVAHDELLERLPVIRDIQHYILGASLPNLSYYQMNPMESKILKAKIWLKLEKINAKYKATTDEKRREKLFQERDKTMS